VGREWGAGGWKLSLPEQSRSERREDGRRERERERERERSSEVSEQIETFFSLETAL